MFDMNNIDLILATIAVALILLFTKADYMSHSMNEVVKMTQKRIVEVEKEHAICYVYEGAFSSKPMNCIKKGE